MDQRVGIAVSSFLFFSLLIVPVQVSAQDSDLGVAVEIPLAGEIQPGSVVCALPEGFALCDETYQTSMYGVYTPVPAAGIELESLTDGKLVVSTGIIQVLVSANNGEIAVGDWITSSAQPGIAQKATQAGFVLGSALQTYSQEEPGLIQVGLQIHPETSLTNSRSNLLEVLRQGTNAPVLAPLDSLRYLLAAILVIASVLLGLIFYGRMSRTTIEAIGRNPLAKRDIQMGVLVQMIITAVVIGFGILAAYIVLII